jgi:hypothetical protein
VEGKRGTLRILATVLVAAMLGCADEQGGPPIKWKTTHALPADFPKDVPIYPGSAVGSAVTGEGMQIEDGAYITWTTSDQIPAVRHFLTDKLDAEGWHVISYPGVPTAWMGEGGVTVVATKWGRTASFAIGAKDGTTLISLVFPQK